MLLKIIFPNGLKVSHARATISAGMFLLAAAVSSLRFLHPSARFGADLIDGLRGMLFGIAIGVTLVGVTLLARIHRHSQ